VVSLSVGELGMPYRVYRVGSEGRFVGIAIEIDGAEDQEAIRKAKQAADGHDIELWEGSRLVVRLSEKGSKAGPLTAAGRENSFSTFTRYPDLVSQGDTGAMETYEEVVQFARDCLRHSRAATTREAAEALLLLARQFQAKAAKLDGGKFPEIEGLS
jgi:hypothetical protein